MPTGVVGSFAGSNPSRRGRLYFPDERLLGLLRARQKMLLSEDGWSSKMGQLTLSTNLPGTKSPDQYTALCQLLFANEIRKRRVVHLC